MKLFARLFLVCGVCLTLLPLTVNSADNLESVKSTSFTADQEQYIPDFDAIKDAEQRKRAFIAYILPSYQQVSSDILSQRKQLEKLKQQLEEGILLSEGQTDWLQTVASQYKQDLSNDISDDIDRLLVRVDILPPELVLSQAATESGWGTSRLARKSNNYFGHFCQSSGCGFGPYRANVVRAKAFSSPTMAVRAYMQNLNSHPAYSKVRQLRADMRANEQPMDAVVLAKGLRRYSSLGDGYVKRIQGMIRTNQQYWKSDDRRGMVRY
jgi:Bax protein